MRLTVVSWNIRKAVGLDWRRDPDRVLAVLNRIGPDIVLLQEADKRLGPRHPALPHHVVEAAGWQWIDADPRTPSLGHHGNAILLRPDHHVADVKPLELPGLEPRGAMLAHVMLDGSPLLLGALHLGLRRRDRRRQLAHILKQATATGEPTILGGDLNEWRDDALPLPQGWQNLSPGASFHAARPLLSLDRFLLSPGVQVMDGGVTPRAEANRASDHLPIWTTVEVDHMLG